jgi:CSLREA domain-containing protein
MTIFVNFCVYRGREENFKNFVGDKNMKKKNFKHYGLAASFVLTLVLASLAIALPSFAESSRVVSPVGGAAFSTGAETEKTSPAAENDAPSVDSETAAVAPAQPLQTAAQQPCVVRDDFNRADGTNMGANWTEANGDFSILGNRAVGTNGSAMSFTGATAGDKACVDVYAAASGVQYGGVYLKWTSYSNNLFVTVQDNDGNGNFDRIFFMRDSGFVYNAACQSGFGISSPFTSARVSVYLDGTTLKADIDTNFDNTPDQSYSCAGAPAKSGTSVGLGIFGGAALDNFGTPPNTLTVTKTADTNDGACDADCSLREAIAAAAPGDTVQFASPLFDSPQTITLGLGDLQINKNLTINGRGAKLLTVSGNSASRVFSVGPGANVTIGGLTVTQGNGSGAFPSTCGGGILVNSATLTLNSSVLTGNSVPFGSSCNDGSGLYIRLGTVNIVNSTINNNSGAAAVANNTGTTNIINSTISNNSGRFAGGIGSFQGANNLTNVTVSGNSATNGPGGIQVNGSAFNVRNSIIANSVGSDCTVNFSLNIQHSLVEDGSCGVTNGINNNKTGDPNLGPLADNGGPTPTHALLANSAAINAGNNCVTDLTCPANNPPFALTTDQRGAGFARKVGTAVDIGAFEFVPSDTTPPVITPQVTGNLGNNGWYTSDIQVSWSVVDNESSISNQTGCSTVNVTTDTSGVTFTCSATSTGGSNSQSVTVKRDATAPTITFFARTTPNPSGWNNTNVAVQWNCADTLSGAVSSSVTTIISTEGVNQSALGICTDNAGNTAQNTQGDINIDKTAPQITLASRTAPNANGWNNTNVELIWNCADTLSGLIWGSFGRTVTTEGTNQSVTGLCRDIAGNESQNTQSGINIDKTAPSITFDSRTAPNANGWNNTNVQVNWNCADALSGAVNSSVSTVVSTEGTNQSALGICTDNAGNTAQNTQSGINIDKTAPTITLVSRTTPNSAGWNNTNVLLQWTCDDTLSGAGLPAFSQTISNEGANQSTIGTCTDNAGNTASDTQSGINIDKTAPSITFDSRTAPNSNGWNNTDVSVNWNCADALSGAVGSSVSQTISGEGVNQSTSGTCADLAGNTAQNTQSGINIDKTAPSISFDSRTPAANAAGWNNTNVAVKWNCADTLSGAVNPSVTQTVSAEGANLSAQGACADLAGNTASNTQSGIKIDKTAPTITLASRTPAANANGWNNTNVTVNWNCADALSGVVNSAISQTVSGEGQNLPAAGTCSDLAGNTAQNTQTGINIDKTAPQITFASRTAPNANGWNNTNVVVNWTCADALSGAASQSVSQTVSTEGANLSSIGTCVDLAGNTASNTQTGIKIDKTNPTIAFVSRTAPNAAGWNNTNVAVLWNCGDGLSGAASPSVSRTLTTEGGNQSATGTCFDLAGNSNSNTQVGIKIDKTAPTLAPVVTPNPVLLNGAAIASPNAADSLSGVASQSCTAVVTSSVGFKTVPCAATDAAGNSASASATYQVVYNFTGFFAPVANLPATNEVVAGQIIDIYFALGGNRGLNVFAAGYPASSPIPCEANAPGATVEETDDFGRNSLTYNSTTGRYRYQWLTNFAWRGTCRMFILKLNDGTERYARFRFR